MTTLRFIICQRICQVQNKIPCRNILTIIQISKYLANSQLFFTSSKQDMVLPGKGQSNFILNFNLSAFALNFSAWNRMMLSILEAQHRTLPFSIKFLNFVFDGSRYDEYLICQYCIPESWNNKKGKQ